MPISAARRFLISYGFVSKSGMSPLTPNQKMTEMMGYILLSQITGRSKQNLPRKMLIAFSEGLQLPQTVLRHPHSERLRMCIQAINWADPSATRESHRTAKKLRVTTQVQSSMSIHVHPCPKMEGYLQIIQGFSPHLDHVSHLSIQL